MAGPPPPGVGAGGGRRGGEGSRLLPTIRNLALVLVRKFHLIRLSSRSQSRADAWSLPVCPAWFRGMFTPWCLLIPPCWTRLSLAFSVQLKWIYLYGKSRLETFGSASSVPFEFGFRFLLCCALPASASDLSLGRFKTRKGNLASENVAPL